MPDAIVAEAVEEATKELIKRGIIEAVERLRAGGEEVTVKEVAREWAVRYCIFAGLPREEAEKVVDEGKLKEVCGEAVRKAYEKYV